MWAVVLLISTGFQRGGLRVHPDRLERTTPPTIRSLPGKKGRSGPAVNERVDPVGPAGVGQQKTEKEGGAAFQPMTVASAVSD
jgi:hypothetical protein